MNVLKDANQNSWPAQRWLFEVYETPKAQMAYGTKTVASVIALCAWNGKDRSFPSYDAISDALGGAGRDTISNAIKKLEEFGFLAVSKVKTKAGNRNDYRLVFPNSLENQPIEAEPISLETPISLDTGSISLETPINQFGYEAQSVHTGGLETIKETLTEPLIESMEQEEEEPLEKSVEEEDELSVILDLLQDNPSSLDAERSLASLGDEASLINDGFSYGVLGDPNWVSTQTQERNAKLDAKREAWGME